MPFSKKWDRVGDGEDAVEGVTKLRLLSVGQVSVGGTKSEGREDRLRAWAGKNECGGNPEEERSRAKTVGRDQFEWKKFDGHAVPERAGWPRAVTVVCLKRKGRADATSERGKSFRWHQEKKNFRT